MGVTKIRAQLHAFALGGTLDGEGETPLRREDAPHLRNHRREFADIDEHSMKPSVAGQISGTIHLDNLDSVIQTVSGLYGSRFGIDALPGFSFADPFATLSIGTGDQTLAAGATFNSPTLTSALGIASQTILARFGADQTIGAGSFNVFGSTQSSLSVNGGGGNIRAANVTRGTFAAEVTYNYDTPVPVPTGAPEPASMALFGVGMLILGAARRRRS